MPHKYSMNQISTIHRLDDPEIFFENWQPMVKVRNNYVRPRSKPWKRDRQAQRKFILAMKSV
jgi:hypothetical protein